MFADLPGQRWGPTQPGAAEKPLTKLRSAFPIPLGSRNSSAAKLSPTVGKAAALTPLFLGSSHTPPLCFLLYFPQDFYCSEEMSQDVSFSPFINIASPKCNYQGQSGTNVC